MMFLLFYLCGDQCMFETEEEGTCFKVRTLCIVGQYVLRTIEDND